MKRILLKISYDGTRYHGWQVQPNAVTVQEVLQNGIEKVLKEKPAVTGCSRTDAGVHAREFYCHLECGDNIPPEAFLRGLNAVLPSDISVRDCKEVASDFHARYNAKAKTYIYRILNSSRRDPFLSRYSWQIERTLNVKLMNEFCRNLTGTHDFYAFSSSGRTVTDTVRTVFDCKTEKSGDIISLEITANGFLYNMVRIITGTAVAVSDGKINPDETEEILISKDRGRAGITAPPQGLTLEKVYY